MTEGIVFVLREHKGNQGNNKLHCCTKLQN